MLRDTGEELQNRASTNSEGNLGAAVRTPQKRGWEEGPPRALQRRKGSARQPHARAPSAPLAPPREREPPAEVLRRALPGVVWSVSPRICGLPAAAAAAAASDPGVRSDVTAMAGIKGGPGALGAGGQGDRPEGG